MAKSSTKLPQLEQVVPPKVLEETGFKLASVPTTPRPSMLISTEGLPKTGQTTFGLSLPRPLYVHELDMRHGDAFSKLNEESRKDIYVSEYSGEMPSDLSGLKEGSVSSFQSWVIDSILTPLVRDFLYACKHARSLFFDKGTDLVELAQMGHFGKLEANQQMQYAHPNSFVVGMLQAAKKAGCIVCVSHELREEYRDLVMKKNDGTEYTRSARTGRWRRKGLSVNKMEHLVDVWGRMFRYDPNDEEESDDQAQKRKVEETTFEMKILGCGAEPAMNGVRIPDPNFETVAGFCKPGVIW